LWTVLQDIVAVLDGQEQAGGPLPPYAEKIRALAIAAVVQSLHANATVRGGQPSASAATPEHTPSVIG
jgi:hypothetical protein